MFYIIESYSPAWSATFTGKPSSIEFILKDGDGWSNNNKMVSTVLYNQIKLSRTRTRNEINKKISRISRDEMEGVFN